MTFPTHPAAVVGLKVWRPRWFDGVALALGAIVPDLAYALDGSGLPVWPLSHQLPGLVGWSLPLMLAGTWTVRRVAPVAAAHLPNAGPLALRDYGAIRAARHRWWVTVYCGLLGAASHLALDRLEIQFAAVQAVLDVVGVLVILAFAVHVGRRRLLRSWHGDPPPVRSRPVLFWGVAGAVILLAAAATPFLPAAHLSHTTGARLLCGVMAGLIAASAAVSARDRRAGPWVGVEPRSSAMTAGRVAGVPRPGGGAGAARIAQVKVAVAGAGLDRAGVEAAVTEVLDLLDRADRDGWYPALEVVRPWSAHNPRITGEFARPQAIRRYLRRELTGLLLRGAAVTARPSRRALGFDDPAFFAALDEDRFDLRAKKLFLFGPERMALSLDRLSHYCGTPAESFEQHVLFTNYAMHVEAFLERFPDAEAPERPAAAQMPAWHHHAPDGGGVSLVNIGVGPANAKTITDHLAVLRPDTMLMIGHCGGLRNHQRPGDFVLATSYLRADRVLDEVLPPTVPVIPNHWLNRFLLDALAQRQATYRLGMVCTTGNRNWEFNQAATLAAVQTARCLAIDMESATVAGNGFRYRIPNATLLCVSDRPLHASPKLAAGAAAFYEASKREHLSIALSCLDRVSREYPHGLPHDDLRSPDEPLLGAAAG